MDVLTVRVITPDGLYLNTKADQINAVSVEGEFGLLPEHMPMVAMLEISKMVIIRSGEPREYAVSGGLLQYANNIVTILTDSIEGEEEIDLQRALAAKKRAEDRLNAKELEFNMQKTEIALRKAINRIHVKEK